MNVNKLLLVAWLCVLAGLIVGCGSSGGPTPTRTPKAVAENTGPTQTPWIIYIPVTTTPEPQPATPLPTVTGANPAPSPTRTRAPVATRAPVTKAPPTPTGVAATEAPTNTPLPSCGQAYQVTLLTFPENGTTRTAKPGSGAGATIQFKWELVSVSQIDPKIGYRVNIHAPANSAALYISHNQYLIAKQAVLSQQATFGLTRGDDATVTWNVDVIMASGGFVDAGDNLTPPLGTTSPCGLTSPTFSINLHVE